MAAQTTWYYGYSLIVIQGWLLIEEWRLNSGLDESLSRNWSPGSSCITRETFKSLLINMSETKPRHGQVYRGFPWSASPAHPALIAVARAKELKTGSLFFPDERKHLKEPLISDSQVAPLWCNLSSNAASEGISPWTETRLPCSRGHTYILWSHSDLDLWPLTTKIYVFHQCAQANVCAKWRHSL